MERFDLLKASEVQEPMVKVTVEQVPQFRDCVFLRAPSGQLVCARSEQLARLLETEYACERTGVVHIGGSENIPLDRTARDEDAAATSPTAPLPPPPPIRVS